MMLEPRAFLDVCGLRMGAMLDAMLRCTPMMQVAGHLLSSADRGRYFAEALLSHLLHSRLTRLQQPGTPESKLVLRLVHLVMTAVIKTMPQV